IDGALLAGHAPQQILAALEEFAIEASILKVASSEALDFILDENVQIHGGNGFVRDYAAERYYRDARVNRIFEGTNEINRLLIPGMFVRRGVKGTLRLVAAAKQLQDDLLTPAGVEIQAASPLDNARRAVAATKKVALMILGTALQTYGDKLGDEQEIAMAAADILIETFAAESVLLRAEAARARGHAIAPLMETAAAAAASDGLGRSEMSARTALAAMTSGDTLRTMFAAL